MTNLLRGVQILVLNKEGMKKKVFHEGRDYEAVADAHYIGENVSNIKSGC